MNACGVKRLLTDNTTINENSVSVHFPGINYTSEISFTDLYNAKNSGAYSSGDSDVLLYELAAKDAFTQIKNGNIWAPDVIIDSLNDSSNVLYSGYMQDFMYLFTGKLCNATMNIDCLKATGIINVEGTRAWYLSEYPEYFEEHPDELDYYVNEACNNWCEPNFEGRSDNNVDATLDRKMNNPNGTLVTLTMKSWNGYHGYAVLSVNGDNVTIMNPNDSSTQTLTRAQLKNSALYLEYIDLW